MTSAGLVGWENHETQKLRHSRTSARVRGWILIIIIIMRLLLCSCCVVGISSGCSKLDEEVRS